MPKRALPSGVAPLPTRWPSFLGFTIVFTLMGASVGLLGYAVRDMLPYLQKAGGIVLVAFGLHTMGVIATVPGTYKIQSKINPAYASAWDVWMPYWLGIYDAGSTENGIHGLPYDPDTGRKTWEDLDGTPITFGCIMLDNENARKVFEVAYIGMLVIVLA